MKFYRLLGIWALIVWSAFMLYFYGSGRIDSYIAERFQIYTLVAGLGLGVLGVFNLVTGRVEETVCDHDHGDGHQHDHDHDHTHDEKHAHHHEHEHEHDHEDGHAHHHEHEHEHAHAHSGHDHEDTTLLGNLVMFAIVLVPMLAASAISQDRFVSAQTIINKGLENQAKTVSSDEWEYTLEDLEKVVDRSEEGNLKLTVDQLFYTNGDAELQSVLIGQPVETIGQLLPEIEETEKDNRLRIFRLMVTCCAADAQPISLPIEFAEGLPEYEEMQWVKVSGEMKYPEEEGRKRAVIQVDSMELTEEPIDYLMF